MTPTVLNKYNFNSIEEFREAIQFQKCIYYASDFLNYGLEDLASMEDTVQHSLQIFSTLDLPAAEHFHPIYRGGTDYIYKDWKLSPLARVYMFVEGDPDNLKDVARKQSELINQLLTHIQVQA